MAKQPTKTLSVRLSEQTIRVLEWDAQLNGYPLRGKLRSELEDRAAAIAEENGWAYGPGTALDDIGRAVNDVGVPIVEDLTMPPPSDPLNERTHP